MKWIDYTALTLAIIGAIVWGLIGVFCSLYFIL